MSALRFALRQGLWPVIVVGTSIAFFVSFNLGKNDVGLLLVPAVVIFALWCLEFVVPDRRGASSSDDPQSWNDVVHTLVSQGMGNALGQLTFVFGAALLAGEISEQWGGNLWPTHWPLWIQVPLLVLLADGLEYWRHRLVHTVDWLWPIHALHHNGEQLNILKSGRGHFLDMFMRNLLCYAPLALAGVPREVMLAHAAVLTVFGPIGHANLSIHLPSFLHRWVMTPQVHRIHHARSLELSSSNYANFPIWDILFGTFEHPDRHGHFEYGIEGDAMPSDIVGQTLAPFAEWRSQWARRRIQRSEARVGADAYPNQF